MNLDFPITNNSQVSYQILTYLFENPEAQDTLEGIVHWWLLERAIKFETARVKEALSDLNSKGLILETTGSDSQTHYRINQAIHQKIQKLLHRKDE